MSHPGLGVMIEALRDHTPDVAALKEAAGRTIRKIEIKDNKLVIYFQGASLQIYDSGQSCCESRYMTTDDDLKPYRGAKFLTVEVKDGPVEEDEGGEPHETQFLAVKTTEGEFTVANHVEHNGYYGGFALSVYFEGPKTKGE